MPRGSMLDFRPPGSKFQSCIRKPCNCSYFNQHYRVISSLRTAFTWLNHIFCQVLFRNIISLLSCLAYPDKFLHSIIHMTSVCDKWCDNHLLLSWLCGHDNKWLLPCISIPVVLRCDSHHAHVNGLYTSVLCGGLFLLLYGYTSQTTRQMTLYKKRSKWFSVNVKYIRNNSNMYWYLRKFKKIHETSILSGLLDNMVNNWLQLGSNKCPWTTVIVRVRVNTILGVIKHARTARTWLYSAW